MSLSSPGSFNDLFLRRIRAPVADIVPDGAPEQHGVLQRNAHLGAQLMQWEIAYVHAIQRHATAINVVETGNEMDQARLARAGRTQDGHRLARLSYQVDALQHGFIAFRGRPVFPYL